MKKAGINISVKDSWVLSVAYKYELPLEYLANKFIMKYDVEVKDLQFSSMTLVFDEGCPDELSNPDRVKAIVCDIMSKKYAQGNFNEDVLYVEMFEVEPVDENENREGDDCSDEKEMSNLELYLEYMEEDKRLSEIDRSVNGKKDGVKDNKVKRGDYSIPDGAKRVIEEVNALAGAKEYKELIKEIASIVPYLKGKDMQELLFSRKYLFSVSDGCGLTTYLEKLHELCCELGVMTKNSILAKNSILDGSVEEFEIDEDCSRKDANSLSIDMAALKIERAKSKVICIDISTCMNCIGSAKFVDFLKQIEGEESNCIIIFRVPFVDKDVLEKIRVAMSDVMTVKAISFPPFGNDEMLAWAKKEMKNNGFTASKNVWKYFNRRIVEEKSDGKFYGFNTVKKVVRELLYKKQLSNIGKKVPNYHITERDAKGICGSFEEDTLSGMQELDRLVGSGHIKEKVLEIMAQIEVVRKNGKVGSPCMHMRFVGNPGTGKTTVARIIGKILSEKGVLSKGGLYEHFGRDFCGKYIGETAPKTASMCREAYGGVLFIDEAYTLAYGGHNDSRDFGREAIDTLISEMENHRGDLIVIMAGYQDDMDKLLSVNAGLKSRMPYTVEFPNFTREELYQIYQSMVQKNFKYEDSLLEEAKRFFTELSDEVICAKDFANARYVRNLFERTWAKAAMRVQLENKAEMVLTCEDFMRASSEKDFTVTDKANKKRLGFY